MTLEESLHIDRKKITSEVTQAIKSMGSGKAGGPDGFTIDFYKEFADMLAPLLGRLYKNILERDKLPQNMAQAIISVLLKKDKDTSLCNFYCPICLLNCDSKILTKILATRIDNIIPKIIDLDQTGFITGRQSFYNMGRLFNIL